MWGFHEENSMNNGKLFLTLIVSLGVGISQDNAVESSDLLYFKFIPDSIKLEIGDSATVSIQLLKKGGDLANNPFYVLLPAKWQLTKTNKKGELKHEKK